MQQGSPSLYASSRACRGLVSHRPVLTSIPDDTQQPGTSTAPKDSLEYNLYCPNLFHVESVLDHNNFALNLLRPVGKLSSWDGTSWLDTAVDHTEIILELPEVEPAYAYALKKPS